MWPLFVFLLHQVADSELTTLITAADLAVAEGSQLRDAVLKSARSDDHETLSDAPRVSQLFCDVEARLRELGRAVASSQGGCVSALRVEEDGAKEALLHGLTLLGSIAPQRTVLAYERSSSAAAGPAKSAAAAPSPSSSTSTDGSTAGRGDGGQQLLQQIDSHVLPLARRHAEDLIRALGRM